MTATAAPAAGERAAVQPAAGGLTATIRYTEYGIPHITARNYTSLGFGNGWAQAKDQVCELADSFLTVRGERSRHYGADGQGDGDLSGASTNLTSDLFFRGLRTDRTAEKLFEAPAPAGPGKDAKALMRGWVAGYNAWLKQNKINDPTCKGASWVRPITVGDLVTLGHSLLVTGGQGMASDGIVAATPPRPGTPAATAPDPAATAREARALFSPDARKLGSNAVAFHGSTTAGGSGMLIGNPHYPWQGARRFWQSQQTIPGELNVSGGSLLGSPAINIGFTDKVAWSHTVSTGVPVSLHELALDPADPTVYLVDGERRRMTQRSVTVAVKDGAPVTRTQWWTAYGPVITDMDGMPLPWTTKSAYALNDPNARHLRFWDTALAFATSSSVDGLQRGLARTQGLPWVNTIAADARGGSFFTQSQVLPRITDSLARRCSTALGKAVYPSSGLAVLDGSRTECALGTDRDALQPGIFGPKKMPTLKNAPYAANSNDSAWLAHPDRPIRGYERVFGDIDSTRSLRTRGGIEDLTALTRRGELRLTDAQRLQFANRAPAGDAFAPALARACAALPGGLAKATDGTEVDVSAACPVLKDWDRTLNVDSQGALLFDRYWKRLNRLASGQKLWKVPFDAKDPVRTPRTPDTSLPAVTTALADVVQDLREKKVPLETAWGQRHYVERAGQRIPVHGGSHALGVWNMMVGVWDPKRAAYTEMVHGTSYVQAVSWNAKGCPVARTLVTYGQSANPLSPHSSDQTRLYSQKKWVTQRFCEKDIRSSAALRTITVNERG
ncbi:penicillin acylase family protein [Streptomyces sp. NPDC057638]|uniref:penicillin acylase family protein n=1 Tax=Streptomyces sp. NPDC057638 TaxID=3346190 RepID=UPI00368BFCB0